MFCFDTFLCNVLISLCELRISVENYYGLIFKGVGGRKILKAFQNERF